MIQSIEDLLTIHGTASEPLVTVKPDGTVEIHKHGADKEAAEVFWRSLQIYGQTIIQQRDALAAELAIYKGREEAKQLVINQLEAALREAKSETPAEPKDSQAEFMAAIRESYLGDSTDSDPHLGALVGMARGAR
jgi:hypothetical protein